MSRPVQSLVSLVLPLPPSVNKAFTSRRGSHLTAKSAAYKFWLAEIADAHGAGQDLPKLARGSYALWIDLPVDMRGDIDNRVKLVSDILRSVDGEHCLRVTDDDKHMSALFVQRTFGVAKDQCVATVVVMTEWYEYARMRLL